MATLTLVAAAGCSGGDDEGSGEDGANSIKVWTIEDVADRVAAQKRMAADVHRQDRRSRSRWSRSPRTSSTSW